MNWKKILFGGLFFALLSCSTNKQANNNEATITIDLLGEQTLAQNEHIFIHQYVSRDVVDTLKATDNAHQLKTMLNTANGEDAYYLSFNEKTLPNSLFIAQNNDVVKQTITLDKNDIRASVVAVETKNKNFQAYQHFNESVKEENDQLETLAKEYRQLVKDGKMETKAQEDAFNKKYDAIDQAIKQKTWKHINNNKNLASLLLFHKDLKYTATVDKLAPALDGYSEEIKATNLYKKVNEINTQLQQIAIGSVAPEFSAPNPEGKTIHLSDFRGNYLLVDFWASWCGPCRSVNPHLVEMYKEYNPKGVEFLGVSYDYPGKRDDWLKAIKDDNLTWTQVSELNGWNTDTKKQYSIYGIPYQILLDKDGKIIANNTDIVQKGLENILKELEL